MTRPACGRGTSWHSDSPAVGCTPGVPCLVASQRAATRRFYCCHDLPSRPRSVIPCLLLMGRIRYSLIVRVQFSPISAAWLDPPMFALKLILHSYNSVSYPAKLFGEGHHPFPVLLRYVPFNVDPSARLPSPSRWCEQSRCCPCKSYHWTAPLWVLVSVKHVQIIDSRI